MFLTSLNMPSDILRTVIVVIPVICLYFTGFNESTSEDDRIESLYDWNETTLWVLRSLGAASIIIFPILMYFNISYYPLNAKVSGAIARHNREKEINKLETFKTESELTNDLEKRSTELKPYPDAVKLDISPEDNQLFLHFSTAELEIIWGSRSLEDSIFTLKRYCIVSLVFSTCTAVALLTALIIDLYGDSRFTSLLISIFVLLSFYIFYETLRILKLNKLEGRDFAEVQKAAKIVYDGEANYHESVKRGMISLNLVAEDLTSPDNRASMTDPIEDSKVKGFQGYTRIYLLLATLTIFFILVATIFQKKAVE